MGGAPPKEGEVTTSSTALKQVIHDIEKDDKEKAIQRIKEILEANGYGY